MKSDEFLSDYYDCGADVSGSNYQTFNTNILAWFEHIDDYPAAKILVEKLESVNDFESWYESAKKTSTGMVGSGRLNWPKDRRRRLGMQISLYRHCATHEGGISDFAHNFMAVSGGNLNDELDEVNSQIFEPMSRDLGKIFERELPVDETETDIPIPASDRYVNIDHNSPVLAAAIDKLSEAIEVVRTNNEYAGKDAEDHEQRLAELEAGRRLLEPKRIDLGKVKWVLGATLLYLADHFAGGVIGVAADAAWAFLKAAIPGLAG